MLDVEGVEDQDDPLLSLFKVHNTKRVNFDLTPQPDEPCQEDEPNGCSKDAGQLSSGFLRKLVKGASRRKKDPSLTASVLLSKKSAAADVPVEDEFIKSMLEPAPLRRMSSFLSGKHWSNILRSNSDNPEGYSDVKSQSGGSLPTSQSFSTIDGATDGSNGARASMSRESKESLARLLKKAKHAHKRSFRYRAAMKYYLLALKEMTAAGYTDSDPLMQKIVKSLNDVHHANSTVSNSANIVQIGIQHEDKDQFIKALKMYTIAYRMRRDSLGVDHPSLPVLLNMMGSVQVKRGEYDEALRIYELSLRGRPDENGGSGRNKSAFRHQNPLTTAVTLRDMAMIFEHKSSEEKALKFYHTSLRYAVKYQSSAKKNTRTIDLARSDSIDYDSETGSAIGSEITRGSDVSDFSCRDWLDKYSLVDEAFSLEEVLIEKSTTIGKHEQPEQDVQATEEMELFIEKRFDKLLFDTAKSHNTKFYYDELFASEDDGGREGGEMDMAMTLHQIAQIHRRGHRHSAALSAYNASLRAMKRALGECHGNTAAILGNIANLYTELGDYDQAFKMYQEVLGIETMHLGLSHPEVAVTLHNIGTIECSRGRYKEGASLFTQVAEMQKIRYGDQHLTVAITLACLADAHEKLGNTRSAIKSYEEALRIRTSALGKSHLDVGRLTHKLARLASDRGEYRLAETYANRASETYRANKLPPNHLFLIEMARDKADIQAGLVFSNNT